MKRCLFKEILDCNHVRILYILQVIFMTTYFMGNKSISLVTVMKTKVKVFVKLANKREM